MSETRCASSVVVDACLVVAALDADQQWGDWAAEILAGQPLASPRHMPFEAGNVLRKLQLAGALDPTSATLAHHELQALTIQLWPHSPLAERAWQLRENLTYYDACYVALAELLDAPLVTLDRRLAQAPGPRCVVLTPPE